MSETEDLQRKVDDLLRQALDHPDPDTRADLIDQAAHWNGVVRERTAADRARDAATRHLRLVPGTRETSVDARLGQVIARVRRTRALTTADLARQLDVSVAETAAYETGAQRISAARLSRIAQVLGVSVTDILREADELN